MLREHRDGWIYDWDQGTAYRLDGASGLWRVFCSRVRDGWSLCRFGDLPRHVQRFLLEKYPTINH